MPTKLAKVTTSWRPGRLPHQTPYSWSPEGYNMSTLTQTLPSLPEIGHPESWYARKVHDADQVGDRHSHEAYKVGQYITLGLDPHLEWEEKLKYFKHAIKRHCQPPPLPDDNVWLFYRQLTGLVRQHAGQQALQIASAEDDLYASRISMGQTRDQIENEAEIFFNRLLAADECPNWFSPEDYDQLKLIRNQWI